MNISLFIYSTAFFISAFFAFFYQRLIESKRIDTSTNCNLIIYKVLLAALFILVLLPVVLISTFRSGVGTDYFSYKEDFVYYSGLSFLEIIKGKLEIGYNLLNLFASKICNHYSSLLFFNAILTLIPVIYVIKKENSNYLWLSLLIFYLTLLPSSLNGMRQAIAGSFSLLALHMLLKGKKLLFALLILVAFLFHQSSLICFGYIFLKIDKNKDVVKKVVLRIFCIIVLIFLINGIAKMLDFMPVLSRYMGKYSETAGYFSLNHYIIHVILRIPIILPSLFLLSKLVKKDINNAVFILLPLCEFIFLSMSIRYRWATRLTYYPMAGQVILVPRIINLFYCRKDRIAMVFYFLLFYIAQFLILFVHYHYDGIFPFAWI